jgi:hypothetical protein
MIVANSSNSASDDHESLDTDQEQALKTQVAMLDAGSSRGAPFIARCIYLEVPDSVKEQHFNVSLFSLHCDMLIIFKKLISNNKCNFRFINIETARTITSVLKSLMEISMFQWS